MLLIILVVHSSSLDLNDILLSLLIRGGLYDSKNPLLGCFLFSMERRIGPKQWVFELASLFAVNEFPIISNIGKHFVCQCISK